MGACDRGCGQRRRVSSIFSRFSVLTLKVIPSEFPEDVQKDIREAGK